MAVTGQPTFDTLTEQKVGAIACNHHAVHIFHLLWQFSITCSSRGLGGKWGETCLRFTNVIFFRAF
jgi:hypothetical protein